MATQLQFTPDEIDVIRQSNFGLWARTPKGAVPHFDFIKLTAGSRYGVNEALTNSRLMSLSDADKIALLKLITPVESNG